MKTTQSKRPADAPKNKDINVRISREAYDIIMKEAELTRRSFKTALNMMVGA